MVTIWSCQIGHKSRKQNFKKSYKLNFRARQKTEKEKARQNFFMLDFSQDFTYLKPEKSLRFCNDNFSVKNPAYGRQSISRPMRIVAPMPQEGGPRKNQQKKTFLRAAILDHFQTKMFKCKTTSFHYFSPRIPNL